MKQGKNGKNGKATENGHSGEHAENGHDGEHVEEIEEAAEVEGAEAEAAEDGQDGEHAAEGEAAESGDGAEGAATAAEPGLVPGPAEDGPTQPYLQAPSFEDQTDVQTDGLGAEPLPATWDGPTRPGEQIALPE